MQEQTFNSIRWLASEVLLRRGALERLARDGVEAFMKDCPFDDLTPEQTATVTAVLDNDGTLDALHEYWVAYDVARLTGDIPDARTSANPWLD